MTHALCRFDEIPDPGARGFVIERNDQRIPIMIVRRNNKIYGYVNSCPHIGAPLDWQEEQFLDIHKQYILCANHGALFTIENGYCISGPCAGKCLQSVSLSLSDGWVLPE